MTPTTMPEAAQQATTMREEAAAAYRVSKKRFRVKRVSLRKKESRRMEPVAMLAQIAALRPSIMTATRMTSGARKYRRRSMLLSEGTSSELMRPSPRRRASKCIITHRAR